MEYKNPCATADVIVERENKIVLIKRSHAPYKDYWALPGGFIEYDKENLEQAATRELYEETNLVVKPEDLELFLVFSEPNRDPRAHVISHCYVVKKFKGKLNAGDDAKEAEWFSIHNLPHLAFDHEDAINKYINWKRKNGK